jgi:hypothetical protein
MGWNNPNQSGRILFQIQFDPDQQHGDINGCTNTTNTIRLHANFLLGHKNGIRPTTSTICPLCLINYMQIIFIANFLLGIVDPPSLPLLVFFCPISAWDLGAFERKDQWEMKEYKSDLDGVLHSLADSKACPWNWKLNFSTVFIVPTARLPF